MPSADERLAILEREVVAMRRDFERADAEVLARIDGPPWEGSMRATNHELRNRVAVLEAAGQVLAEAQRERRKAFTERDTATRRRRAEWWKIIGAVTALLAVVLPWVHVYAG